MHLHLVSTPRTHYIFFLFFLFRLIYQNIKRIKIEIYAVDFRLKLDIIPISQFKELIIRKDICPPLFTAALFTIAK